MNQSILNVEVACDFFSHTPQALPAIDIMMATLMKHPLVLAAVIGATAAMRMPASVNESTLCARGLCSDPHLKYERKAATQPGYQWDDAGGYCGSW